MKRSTLFVSVLLVASLAMGQNEKYYQKMGETLQGFSSSSSREDFQDLANRFRVIGNVETSEWLPLYYEAQCYIMIGFMGEQSEKEKDSYLDKASSLIERMQKMAPDEAEIHVLEAYCLTGSLVVNPPQRAMETTPLIHASITRAQSLEPNNPRALLMSISNEIGTAQFFGDDITSLCKEAVQLLQNWDSYRLKSPIHPNWGKPAVEGIVKECGE